MLARMLAAVVVLGPSPVGCGEAASGHAIAFAPELTEVEGAGPWVQPELRAALARARWLREQTAADVPALPLRIGVAQVRDAGDRPVLRLVADATPPEPWQPRLGPAIDAVVEVEAVTGDIDPVAHGKLALDRAVAVLDAKIGLALAGRDAVAHVLAADDPQIVVHGLEYVADQRARELADDVAALLHHADDRVRLRAIECLGIVGGPQHVRALVRQPRLADRAYAQRVYDTLARLGGDEARGFLEFAANNEDDPIMAEVAADALARLRGEIPIDAAPSERRGHR